MDSIPRNLFELLLTVKPCKKCIGHHCIDSRIESFEHLARYSKEPFEIYCESSAKNLCNVYSIARNLYESWHSLRSGKEYVRINIVFRIEQENILLLKT